MVGNDTLDCDTSLISTATMGSTWNTSKTISSSITSTSWDRQYAPSSTGSLTYDGGYTLGTGGGAIESYYQTYYHAMEDRIGRQMRTWYDEFPANFGKTPQERMREIIQSRQAPAIHRSRKSLHHPETIEETRARETLKAVLGMDKFRSFIKNGFVSVRANSGLVYQIFPGHDMTTVYRDGEPIERLCVVLKGKFPPTDSLIMRYLLILNDEKDFRSYAITYRTIRKQELKVVTQEPLTAIFNRLKAA